MPFGLCVFERSCSQSKICGGAVAQMIWCGIDIYPCYHQLNNNVYGQSWRGVLDTTCGSTLMVTLGTPVSSTNKTDRHAITKILLKWSYNDRYDMRSPLNGPQTRASKRECCSIVSAEVVYVKAAWYSPHTSCWVTSHYNGIFPSSRCTDEVLYGMATLQCRSYVTSLYPSVSLGWKENIYWPY